MPDSAARIGLERVTVVEEARYHLRLMNETSAPRRLAAILHADVVGYSRLMGADEEGTIDRLTDYRRAMTSGIEQFAGRVVDTAGDSLLAEFASVVAATKCALELQRMLDSRNRELPPDRRLEFRMGIEMADVIARDGAVYGDAINVAARIQALAEAGGICVSDGVRRAVANRLPVTFTPLGEQSVKNISEPIKVYRVILDETKDTTAQAGKNRTGKQPRRPRISMTLAAIVLIGLAALLTTWVMKQNKPPVKTTDTAVKQSATMSDAPRKDNKADSTIPSIAVLPFVNMSGNKDQEYFSDGISEDIIIDLSQVSNLKVIARNSSFYYKDRALKTEDVGRDLGVRYILTGSVRRAGDRIRITAQLTDSNDAHQLWADKYDRKLEDIFSLQDEITQKIVSALVVQLGAHEVANLKIRSTRNVAAYDLFLKGLQSYGLGTMRGMETAREYYRQAIQLDPRFGRAYGALAVAHTRAIARGFEERTQEKLDQALGLAQQAVDLNSSLPQTYWALGYVHRHRHEIDEAINAAQRSIEVAPNYADGYGLLATVYNQAGRGEEAIRIINRAMALNPHHTWEYENALGQGYYLQGRYEQAVGAFRSALARNELVSLPRLFLISCYVRLDRIDDARWEVTQLQTHNPEITISQVRPQAYFHDADSREQFLSDLGKAGVAP